ncbi:uncharacterized protein BO88DRAFT_489451 [Aspergillus vadensis CBS 113365]|uniref:Uncharacterized protein n=1 Tax=Aspergillus vadensis (strain CBS 113365 / IMI 142717 / IBT 24658) TaxID=1448311 RepID=A0A319BN39_ASPVC|nr:hypothetical protein BO88DRAFT_489451 [Aspergillus vadensis CBS 113365]PYH67133.1 hypothetical protein BO88DRAFT_489451 [Aspergillus vadensis CBS 113365]
MAVYFLLHGAIAIARADNRIALLRHDWVSLLAAAAVYIMIPVILHTVVRRYCQVVLKSYYLLAVMVMVALVYYILSTRLYLCEWLYQRRQPALLLGLYGRSIDFSLFGTIVFIVEDIDHQCWLGDWMQDLLDHDCGEFKILEFRLYYLTKGTSVNPGDAFGERTKLFQGPLMAREIIQGYLSKRRGKLAVGVCAR